MWSPKWFTAHKFYITVRSSILIRIEIRLHIIIERAKARGSHSYDRRSQAYITNETRSTTRNLIIPVCHSTVKEKAKTVKECLLSGNQQSNPVKDRIDFACEISDRNFISNGNFLTVIWQNIVRDNSIFLWMCCNFFDNLLSRKYILILLSVVCYFPVSLTSREYKYFCRFNTICL